MTEINPAYAPPVEAHVASLGEKLAEVLKFLANHQAEIRDILSRLAALEQAAAQPVKSIQVEKEDK